MKVTLKNFFDFDKRELYCITGTVKLHGTHSDIRLVNGEIVYQSRNRIINKEKENKDKEYESFFIDTL